MRVREVASIVLVLGLGCRPGGPDAPSSPPAPPVTTTSDAGASPAGPEASPPPAADLPDTCTIELEVVMPSGAKGHGASDESPVKAKEAAWAQACAQLRTAADLDCKDSARVGVLSQRSSSLRSARSNGATEEHYEHDVVLGSRRTAEGFGDAPGDRQEACRRAKAHACEQLLGAPCPETGVRVIAVDGKPPNPAAVEPAPKTTAPRETI